MSVRKATDFNVPSLRGGQDDTTAPNAVADDQCVSAVNVEFNISQLGERRNGSLAISSPAAITALASVTFLGRHLPSSDRSIAELFAVGATVGSAPALQRRTTVWNSISITDTATNTGDYLFKWSGASVHQKYFLGYKSNVDRLHVWDGSTLRRVGLAMPSAAPTGANTGIGTLASTRYYRIRYTVKSGAVTLLRSEPSLSLTFTPSGSGTGVIVTKPVTISENETHWELEASLDNINYYVLATTAVATPTVTDSTSAVTGYATGVLSADIGDYTVPGSAKFVSIDDDRLILGGSWEVEGMTSRVAWTPVYGDLTGQGNDERIPLATDNFLDLDAGNGGELTALSGTVDGSVYAFKWSQIWKLTRTGQRAQAYTAFAISKVRGAIDGSVVEGLDDAGRPVLFFLDPKVGPMRIGASGLFWAGKDIKTTWERVNIEATQVIARGLFYPQSNQVKWTIAVDGSNTPNLGLTLQLDNVVMSEDGLRKGWSLSTGDSTQALAMVMYSSNVDTANPRMRNLVPLIGVASVTGAHIQILNTGVTDNGTAYVASITTKPYSLAGILNKFRLRAAALFAEADANSNLRISITRDMGLETATVDVNLAPEASETDVVKQMDNLTLGEMHMAQITISDVDVPSGQWVLNALSFKPSSDGTA